MGLPQERFSQGSSFLHRADPRAKIVTAAALSLVLACTTSFSAAWAGLGLGCVLVLAARLPLRSVGLRLLAVNGFVFFLWLVLPFTYPGSPAFTLGPLAASHSGLDLAGLITLKCNAILLAFIALVSTSPVPDLGYALQALRLPSKLCWLLLLTYRYIFVIGAEYQRMHRAALMRGFVPRNSLHTYRTYANLFAMTLVRSWDRSERVYQAMLLRGFHGRFHSLRIFKLRSTDICLLLAGIGSATALACMECIA